MAVAGGGEEDGQQGGSGQIEETIAMAYFKAASW